MSTSVKKKPHLPKLPVGIINGLRFEMTIMPFGIHNRNGIIFTYEDLKLTSINANEDTSDLHLITLLIIPCCEI